MISKKYKPWLWGHSGWNFSAELLNKGFEEVELWQIEHRGISSAVGNEEFELVNFFIGERAGHVAKN